MRYSAVEASNFIASHSAELAKIAKDANLNELAYILQMASHEADFQFTQVRKPKVKEKARLKEAA